MILNTKEFAEICKTISLAVSEQAANLELKTENDKLYLSVTNGEYFVKIMFNTATTENFRAVVDANLFLNLIAGLTTETFELSVTESKINIKAGKSKYSVALIYENDCLMTLPRISLDNPTVEMSINQEILQSILKVNSKELVKTKIMQQVNELQKLYYITEEGCFTFTTGACLNSFSLEKPVKMLLNDRIVKLFRLFDTPVSFKFGYDALANGTVQTKVVFTNETITLTAIITNDDILLQKIQGPVIATRNYLKENYENKVVLSVAALKAALNRLMLFTKNSVNETNMLNIPATVTFSEADLTITDNLLNSESIAIENGSYVNAGYSMVVNLADIKLILDSCICDHITLNCGNHRSVVLTRGQISNLISECKRD